MLLDLLDIKYVEMKELICNIPLLKIPNPTPNKQGDFKVGGNEKIGL